MAFRSQPPSRVSSPTSPAAMLARASCDISGERFQFSRLFLARLRRAAIGESDLIRNRTPRHPIDARLSAHALGHAARHKATDADAEVAPQRPYHGSANPVRFGDHGIFRYVDPFAIEADAIMTVLRFPIDVADRRSVGVGAARPLAGFEAVEPGFKRRTGIAAIIAGVPAMGNQNQRQY